MAAWLTVMQAWRHQCNPVVGDVCWTLLTGLMLGAGQGMSPDPSLQRLPLDLALAVLLLGLVSALVCLPLLSPWRMVLQPVGSLPRSPSYPARPAMLASTLAWQVINAYLTSKLVRCHPLIFPMHDGMAMLPVPPVADIALPQF